MRVALNAALAWKVPPRVARDSAGGSRVARGSANLSNRTPYRVHGTWSAAGGPPASALAHTPRACRQGGNRYFSSPRPGGEGEEREGGGEAGGGRDLGMRYAGHPHHQQAKAPGRGSTAPCHTGRASGMRVTRNKRKPIAPAWIAPPRVTRDSASCARVTRGSADLHTPKGRQGLWRLFLPPLGKPRASARHRGRERRWRPPPPGRRPPALLAPQAEALEEEELSPPLSVPEGALWRADVFQQVLQTLSYSLGSTMPAKTSYCTKVKPRAR